jgi:hypothetical protein
MNLVLEFSKDKYNPLDGFPSKWLCAIRELGYIFTNKRRSSGHRVTQDENHT